MKKALINQATETNTFTGELENITLYNIETAIGCFEIEIKDTLINGVVTIEAADYNIKTLETIYNHFDNLGDYELYLDNNGRYTYLDITTWGCPDDIKNIMADIEKILEQI